MIGFFVAAGLLLATALLFVIPPLIGKRRVANDVSHGDTNLSIYRDQLRELDAELEAGTVDRLQFENAKREIERRVLEEVEEEAERRAEKAPPSWTLAIAVAVGIPIVAIPLYLLLGKPEALNPDLVAAAQGGDQGHALTPERVATMVAQLKQKLEANPDDGDGWLMLAKTTSAIGRFDESARAYGEAIKRIAPDAQVYADYADTLAMASGRNLMGPPEKLIEQALKIDGNNVKALALLGSIAFQRQDYAKAATTWKKILTLVPPESDLAQRIGTSISDAEAKAGGKSAGPTVAAARDTKQAADATALNGQVELSAEAAKAVTSGDTVFVFARAASGPKMPLAIVKLQVKDLPTAFKLDESMAMAPGMSISKFPELVVGARVSKSGNATPGPGDWESELTPAKAGASDLRLVIKRKI